MRRDVLMFLMCVTAVACGGSNASGPRPLQPTSSTAAPSGDETTTDGELQSHGDGSCVSQYFADRNITTLGAQVEGVGIVVGVLPDAGWSIQCVMQERVLLEASLPANNRLFTLLIERNAAGMPEINAFAQDELQRVLQGASAAGMTLRGSATTIDADTYVHALEGTQQNGQPIAMLGVHSLLISPAGVLHYHVSESAPTGQALNAHCQHLIDAAQVFAIAPPENSSP